MVKFYFLYGLLFLFFLASFTVYIEKPLKKSVEFFRCSPIICIVDKAHIRAKRSIDKTSKM